MKKLCLFLLCSFFMGGCSSDDELEPKQKDCKCGTVNSQRVYTDGEGNIEYIVNVVNNCTLNLKSVQTTRSSWLRFNVGDEACIGEEW